MEAIKQWAFCACISVVIGVVASFLSPPGNMEKIYKYVISLFFLCCLFSPVLFKTPLFKYEIKESPTSKVNDIYNNLTAKKEEQYIRSADEVVKKAIEPILQKYDMELENSEIDSKRNDDGSIIVTKVIIYLNRKDSGHDNEIKQALYNNLGIEAEIVYS